MAWRCLRRCRWCVSVRLSLLFSVSRSALGSCLLPNVTHQFFLFTLYIYLQEKHSSDVARRAVLPSVRRYSLYEVKSRIRSCAILFRVAPPTPASHWTSASPLPQFHIQMRFPFTQHSANPYLQFVSKTSLSCRRRICPKLCCGVWTLSVINVPRSNYVNNAVDGLLFVTKKSRKIG